MSMPGELTWTMTSAPNGYTYTLPFEEPVTELEKQIAALEQRDEDDRLDDELKSLRENRDSMLTKLYRNLSPWDTVRVARHPDRPQTSDYIRMMCRDFRELHGDRHFGDDPAVITGFGRIGSHKVLLVGHQKGRTTQEKVACHFGCAHPEGYRKALKKMKLAEKFGLPIVTLIDTPGAFPGVKAEERGQAEAIARNLLEMSRLHTPILCAVIGEGGSGGALGVGVGDRVAMLSNAWYSVISPEGCAAILWKEANEQTNTAAAEALALTAADNLRNGLIDEVIPEPLGGAHRAPQEAADSLRNWIIERLRQLKRFKPATLVRHRYEKLRRIGALVDAAARDKD
ncbi:MAG: acetyl-CoA carboxylase carboxyltransferase subunit alpha [Phycisphaerales bacterium]|nr:MAG: acetyl-CoA carboxylase carboxyltransferase subunit alpha [Phycisphaerales bacterium]